MTLIQGTLRDSGGVLLQSPIFAKLRVTLDAAISDGSTSPATTYLPITYTSTISAGVLAVEIPETATANTTAFFELFTESTRFNYFFLDGEAYLGPTHLHTDGKYYTGETHSSESVELTRISEAIETRIQAFHAIVPNQAAVNWAELVPTGVSIDVLDTSLRRLAEIVTQNPDYVELLRGGPRWLGEYSAAISYQQDDAVSYGGSSWIWINPDPGTGQTPAIGIYWARIADRGAPGGTGGAAGAYDPVGWNGDTQAPTKDAVRDVFVTLAAIASPNFSGTPTTPTPASGNDSTQISNTEWVLDRIFQYLNDASLTGAPTALTPPLETNSTRLANTSFVKGVLGRYCRMTHTAASGTGGGTSVAGINTRPLNNLVTNSGDIVSLTSNTFTLRPGTYAIFATSTAYRCNGTRLLLWNNSDSVRVIDGSGAFQDAVAYTAGLSLPVELRGRFTVAGGNKDFQLRQWFNAGLASVGMGVAIAEAGFSELYTVVELLRLD